jgi:DNA phosphorothioation-associated DGQHR protein 1
MAKPFLEVPAISVSQPIGEFFLCAIPASALLDVTYSIPASMRREGGMFAKMMGNQRVKSNARGKQIGAYIDEEESTFPNTIILSVNYFEDGSYAEDDTVRWYAKNGDRGSFMLTIPSNKKLASIIDGQHRLEGFNNVQKPERLTMQLPCAVYINLPRAYQAKIFATININQKRVDKSLAYELFGYDLNDSSADRWPPDMLGVYIARILEGKNGSPFQGHIKLALLDEDEGAPASKGEPGNWEVSIACLVEGISRLLSDKPATDRSALASGTINDRRKLPIDGAPLRNLYVDCQDKTLLDLISAFFSVAKELLWNGQPEKSFITRTVGVLATFDVFREALKAGELDINDIDQSAKVLFENARGINFADDYFHASGAGRVRIRNVLKLLVGLTGVTDQTAVDAVTRLTDARLQT